jgi:hypothetical protein
MPKVKAHTMPNATRREVRCFSRCRGKVGSLGPTVDILGPQFLTADETVSFTIA